MSHDGDFIICHMYLSLNFPNFACRIQEISMSQSFSLSVYMSLILMSPSNIRKLMVVSLLNVRVKCPNLHKLSRSCSNF